MRATGFRLPSCMLECAVRGCRQSLARDERRLICPRGHSFDIARSGYLNLLQPQDRRSKRPGDTPAAVKARRRLFDRGIYKPLLGAIGEILDARPADSILDAGCGNGDYLGTLARDFGFDAHGIDISVPAIEAAARRYPKCEWVVGNADRFIPYSDGSFSAVMSITARRNTSEFRRVLHRDGRLLVAIPAPDDLIELRGAGRDRVSSTIEGFRSDFALVEQRRATTTADLEAEAVDDVLHSIYRPVRSMPVQAMRLTFSLDLLLFRSS